MEMSAERAAVILPRVQVHFDLTSEVVGLLSASTMAGVSDSAKYTVPGKLTW
jgi:hypothetical protein